MKAKFVGLVWLLVHTVCLGQRNDSTYRAKFEELHKRFVELLTAGKYAQASNPALGELELA